MKRALSSDDASNVPLSPARADSAQRLIRALMIGYFAVLGVKLLIGIGIAYSDSSTGFTLRMVRLSIGLVYLRAIFTSVWGLCRLLGVGTNTKFYLLSLLIPFGAPVTLSLLDRRLTDRIRSKGIDLMEYQAEQEQVRKHRIDQNAPLTCSFCSRPVAPGAPQCTSCGRRM